MPSNDAVSVTPKYLIGRVTKLTGLSVDVVRVWERRYGAVRPVRSDGGTRLYSDADILRLKRLRLAVDGGHSISQAARLSESELDELIAEAQRSVAPSDPYLAVRQRFTEAVGMMDVVAAEQELARAATLFPAGDLAKRVIAPILDEVGERWARKEFGIAHEHLATGLVRSTLGSLFRLYAAAEKGETMVLATPPGERHELGLLLVALLAAAHGWRVVYLGTEVPPAEMALAVRLTNARVLALSLASGCQRSDEELAAISSFLPISTRVWIGGADAARHRELINRANWILLRDLEELDDQLARSEASPPQPGSAD
jgi:DNA-binding transcriptional MerR regulator